MTPGCGFDMASINFQDADAPSDYFEQNSDC